MDSREKTKRATWVVLGLLVAVGLMAAFLRKSELPVRAERPARESIANTIFTNGKVEPLQNFEAHSPAPATVRRVLVREGEWVQPGQLLVQLDDADARAQVAKALAQLRSSEADLHNVHSGGSQEELLTNQSLLTRARTERDEAQRSLAALKRLEQTGAASHAEVTAADDRLKKAQAEVTLLENKQKARYSHPEVARVQAQSSEARASYAAALSLLRTLNVTSPLAGKVYSLPIKEGSYVAAGDILVQVADLKRVLVRAFVDEPDIGKIAEGQSVSVSWDGLPGRAWEGKISHVPTTVVMHGTRTVGEITCTVDNQDGKLLPNVDVSVTLTIARHENVLTLPREAVHQEGEGRFVYAIEEGQLKRKPVETSVSNLTRVEITGGVTENAMVALGSLNSQPLRDGMLVRVVKQ